MRLLRSAAQAALAMLLVLAACGGHFLLGLELGGYQPPQPIAPAALAYCPTTLATTPAGTWEQPIKLYLPCRFGADPAEI